MLFPCLFQGLLERLWYLESAIFHVLVAERPSVTVDRFPGAPLASCPLVSTGTLEFARLTEAPGDEVTQFPPLSA